MIHHGSESSGAVRGLAPGGRIRGRIAVPGSKSLAQRALVIAGLCGGTTRIAGLSDGDDVARALALVAACGAGVERLAPAAVAVTGRPPGPHRGWSPRAPLELGESGTLARLATAAIALCGHAGRGYELTPSGSLRRRSSRALFDALRASGVQIERTTDGDAADDQPIDRWPVRITPLGPPPVLRIVRPASSQEVSALLLALAAYPGESRLEVEGDVPSRPYLEMTIAMLSDFGARIASARHGGAETWTVAGPLTVPAAPIAIEPDASSAAVAAAAACASGGEVTIPSLTPRSRQGDVRIVEHLAAFGCSARLDESGLSASGRPTRAADLDLSGEPDLAPVLAIVAAAAARDVRAASRLSGLASLPGKESPRIEVLARGLAAVGFETEAGRDFLKIAPPRGALRSAVLDPAGDHRMAFAFALLGLLVDGVLVRDAECVAKSWPRFWSDLERAGARVVRGQG